MFSAIVICALKGYFLFIALLNSFADSTLLMSSSNFAWGEIAKTTHGTDGFSTIGPYVILNDSSLLSSAIISFISSFVAF
jgi:hypothetical protein